VHDPGTFHQNPEKKKMKGGRQKEHGEGPGGGFWKGQKKRKSRNVGKNKAEGNANLARAKGPRKIKTRKRRNGCWSIGGGVEWMARRVGDEHQKYKNQRLKRREVEKIYR